MCSVWWYSWRIDTNSMEPNDDNTRTHIVLNKGAMVSHYRIVENTRNLKHKEV